MNPVSGGEVLNRPVTFIFYMPTLHRGYLEFLARHGSTDSVLYLIDAALAQQYGQSPYPDGEYQIELRALDAEYMVRALRGMKICPAGRITTITPSKMASAQRVQIEGPIVTLNEVISRRLIAEHFPEHEVIVDNAFVRHDSANVRSERPVRFDRESTDAFDREMILRAREVGDQSNDEWRQVGAIAVWKHNRQVALKGYNHHVPGNGHLDVGDPRHHVAAGTESHITTALHAEQDLITSAALSGTSTEGLDLYVSIFPCPMCAKEVAAAGFARVFFCGGHASLEGDAVMRAAGVELVHVDMEDCVAGRGC